jgi:hypothetical protein
MTIWAIFYLLLFFSSEVKSQLVVSTSSHGLTTPSPSTTNDMNPSIEPAFGGGTVPSRLSAPLTLRVSPPSGPAIAPFTFPPLIQNFPSPPAGNDVCLVCGEGFQVVDKRSKIMLAGKMYTCGQMEAAGLRRQIPNPFCISALVESIAVNCGCQEKSISRTKAPTRVRSKSPVIKPATR